MSVQQAKLEATAPAPWSWCHDGHGGAYIGDANERQIGFVSNRPDQKYLAHLIASAPDLLEASRKALGVLAGTDMNKQALIDALTMLRAALSRATPSTPLEQA